MLVVNNAASVCVALNDSCRPTSTDPTPHPSLLLSLPPSNLLQQACLFLASGLYKFTVVSLLRCAMVGYIPWLTGYCASMYSLEAKPPLFLSVWKASPEIVQNVLVSCHTRLFHIPLSEIEWSLNDDNI